MAESDIRALDRQLDRCRMKVVDKPTKVTVGRIDDNRLILDNDDKLTFGSESERMDHWGRERTNGTFGHMSRKAPIT